MALQPSKSLHQDWLRFSIALLVDRTNTKRFANNGTSLRAALLVSLTDLSQLLDVAAIAILHVVLSWHFLSKFRA